jgi:hypothetical protein
LSHPDTIPMGFVRILDDGTPICDAPVEEAKKLLDTDLILWDEDVGYQMTPEGRAYIKARLLN